MMSIAKQIISTFALLTFAATTHAESYSCNEEKYENLHSLSQLPKEIIDLVNPNGIKSVADAGEGFNGGCTFEPSIPHAGFDGATLSQRHAFVSILVGGFILHKRTLAFYKDQSGWHEVNDPVQVDNEVKKLEGMCEEFSELTRFHSPMERLILESKKSRRNQKSL